MPKRALLETATQKFEQNIELAHCEAHKANSLLLDVDANLNEHLDLTVSYDGSWHKRGFTRKYEVGWMFY